MKTRTLTFLVSAAALLFVTGTIFFTPAAAQDFQTGYFLGGYNHAFRMNPAIQNERSIFAVGLGNLGVGALSDQLDVDALIYKVDGKLVTGFDDSVPADTFLGKLSKNKSNLLAAGNVDVLTLGFWSKRNYVTFDVRARVDAAVSAPYDLFAFMKSPQSLQSLDFSGTSLGLNGFLEAAIGVSHNFNNKFNVGGRVKFLYGLLSAQATLDHLTASYSQDAWTFDGHGSIEASSPFVSVGTTEDGNIDFENIETDFQVQNLLKPSGMGAAIDLGLTWNVLPWLTLSGAVLDLGAIRWNRDIYGETSANYTWEPDAESEDDGLDEALDALSGLMNFRRETSDAAFTRLPITAIAGVEIRIPGYERLSFGALGTLRHSAASDWMEGRASVNWSPANALSFTANTTVNNLGQFVGFALNLHPGALNLFIGTDYIPIKSHPLGYFLDADSDLPDIVKDFVRIPSGKLNANLYFGLNLAFGKRHLDYARRYIL